MNRKPGLCRFGWDPMKSGELNFANDSMRQEAIRIVGIPCLRTCESRRHNEQRKKRHGYGSTTAHVSQHLEKTELMDEGVRPKVALRRAASVRYNLAATISSAWGGGDASLGDRNLDCGSCFGVLRAGADETAGEMGRVDGGGVSTGDRQGARDLPAAVRDFGKAWAALAAGNRPVERALCDRARRAAGILGDFPGLLFWTDSGSAARGGNGGVQRGHADEIAAGNDR